MTACNQFLTSAESYLAQRRLHRARRMFELAENAGCEPDRCAAGRWTAAMLAGDFASAWSESDVIRRRGAYDPHRFWQGEQWRGKRVLLRCLHGFGDAVQFLRYAPLLSACCAELTVECAPRAVALLRCLRGVERVISWEEDPPPWEVQMEIMELPYVFRSTVADLPIATEYVHLPQAMLDRAADALGRCDMPRVGLAWSAGEWNRSRSIPFPLLAPILTRTDCQFWNLQGGPERAQWKEVAGAHLCDSPLLDDAGLVPLAAIIAQLDLVITVDTLAAHLAGALGVPCFLLLQYSADWRWMIGRDDSPWYPLLRLFRQSAPDEWAGAIVQASRALDRWAATNKRAVA